MLCSIVEQIPQMQLEYRGNIYTSSISIGAVFRFPEDTCPEDLIRHRVMHYQAKTERTPATVCWFWVWYADCYSGTAG